MTSVLLSVVSLVLRVFRFCAGPPATVPLGSSSFQFITIWYIQESSFLLFIFKVFLFQIFVKKNNLRKNIYNLHLIVFICVKNPETILFVH